MSRLIRLWRSVTGRIRLEPSPPHEQAIADCDACGHEERRHYDFEPLVRELWERATNVEAEYAMLRQQAEQESTDRQRLNELDARLLRRRHGDA